MNLLALWDDCEIISSYSFCAYKYSQWMVCDVELL